MFLKKSRFALLTIFLLTLIIFTGKTSAQLDPTFGTNGVVRTYLGGAGTTVASFVLPDGKLLIVADARIGNEKKTIFIRYNSDGTPDSTYGTDGKIQLPIPYFTPNRGITLNAARQTDGKIVIAGADVFANQYVPLVARFNEDGTLDTTFAQGNGISRPNPSTDSDRFSSVIIQPDGKILLAGGAGGIGSPYLFLMRYQANGAVDASFGTNNAGYVIHSSFGSQDANVGQHLYLQSTGKFIVGNLKINPSGLGVHRFNSNGTLDNSFTFLPSSGTNQINVVGVQPDDKILTGGNVSQTDILEMEHLNARIKRYNADGTLDITFGDAGQVSFDTAGYSDEYPNGFQIMPDGQILVALRVQISQNRTVYNGPSWVGLVRLSADGAVSGRLLAASFASQTTNSIVIQPDGKILVASRGNVEGQPDGSVKIARANGIPAQTYALHARPDFLPSLAVYRPSTNGVYFRNSTSNLNTGFTTGDILASADFIGSNAVELTYFRPSNGTWYMSRGLSRTNIKTVRWGMEGDVPVPADYDRDGKADPAVFRPADGNWYIYHIADGSSSVVKWGIDGDKPVVGDYDGDGTYDRAIWRPATGEWWILRSSDGGYTLVQFGLPGDIPVQEDYDGDGKFDIAVYRPSTGEWYRINSSDASFFTYQWGLPGDVPVPGDYDGDQKANVAVWRPVNGAWYIVNPDYQTMTDYSFGQDGDRPLLGRY